MAVNKNKRNMFSNVLGTGTQELNPLLQEKEKNIPKKDIENVSQSTQSKINDKSAVDDPNKSDEKIETSTIAQVKKKLETRHKSTKDTIRISIKHPSKDAKRHVTFILKESTVALIAQYSGCGTGKDRTGYNKSEFVDMMLVKAINAMIFDEKE